MKLIALNQEAQKEKILYLKFFRDVYPTLGCGSMCDVGSMGTNNFVAAGHTAAVMRNAAS